jgi:hypothetical protein
VLLQKVLSWIVLSFGRDSAAGSLVHRVKRFGNDTGENLMCVRVAMPSSNSLGAVTL